MRPETVCLDARASQALTAVVALLPRPAKLAEEQASALEQQQKSLPANFVGRA